MTTTTEILEIQANTTIIEIVDEETILEITEDVTIIEVAGVGIQGAQGPQGPAGTAGAPGAAGVGVPAGGTEGQILAKNTATNYDTGWIDNYTTDVRKFVKNDSGVTLVKGTVVYVSGANGANVLVKPAIATGDGTSATTVGILNQELLANGQGYAIVEGTISGIDTSSATAGDPVWLSGTTAGGLLFGAANKPYAPYHIVYLGTVTRAHANQGQIEVSVNNGWELDELHNVSLPNVQNGDSLKYESSTGLWKGAQTTYVHTQNSVSDLWTITHNLGFYPQVSVSDSGGTNVEGAVNYISNNQLTVSFGFSITGTAYLS